MPNYTEILGLEQPFQDENYNVDVFNENARKIDEYMIPLAAPAVVNVTGRTLVNLLGRAGNFIYKQDWTLYASTYITTNDYAEITKTISDNGAISTIANCENGKLYLLLCDVTNISCAYVIPSAAPRDASYKSRQVIALNNEELGYMAFKSTQTANNQVNINVVGNTGAKAKVRNVRLYEITQAEYDALDTMTAEQIAEKYPYVDDVKPVVNPYIESKENLLDGCSVLPDLTYGFYGETANVGAIGVRSCIGESVYLYPGTYTLASDIFDKIADLQVRISAFTGDETSATNTLTDLVGAWGTLFTVPVTITVPNGYKFIRIAFRKTNDAVFSSTEYNLLKLAKFTLVKGTTPKAYDECHNSRIMFETKLYSGEKISRRNDGQYVKDSEYAEYVVESTKNPYYVVIPDTYDSTCKVIAIKDSIFIGNNANAPLSLLISYYGKILKYASAIAGNPNDKFWLDSTNGILYINLPNTLTGWGATYTPTDDEIKAFFLGWRMVDSATGLPFTGTNKGWWKLWCGIGTNGTGNWAGVIPGTSVANCPTTLNDQGYTPYKLIYKKATPTLEEVKVHGFIDKSDYSVITVGSGLVLEERASSQYSGVVNSSDINPLRNRTDNILTIYNDKQLLKYTITVRTNAETAIIAGRSYATISQANEIVNVDYLIYKPDTVQSFDYTITTDDDLKTVVEKLVEENSAVNAELAKTERELVRAKIELSQRSNPNLLINGDFRVWQRGNSFTTNSTTKYTVDRWVAQTAAGASTGTVTKLTKGAKIQDTANLGVSSIAYLRQYFPKSELDLGGKTVTFSVYVGNYSCDNSGVEAINIIQWFGGAASITKAVLKKGLNVVTAKISNMADTYTFDIWLRGSGCFAEVLWAKLELGEYATPFVPRSYAEELAMCQRYYETVGNQSIGVAISATDIVFATSFKLEKRTQPTIAVRPEYTNFYVLDMTSATLVGGVSNKTIAATLYDGYDGKTLRITGFTGLTIGRTYAMPARYLSADAEIY